MCVATVIHSYTCIRYLHLCGRLKIESNSISHCLKPPCHRLSIISNTLYDNFSYIRHSIKTKEEEKEKEGGGRDKMKKYRNCVEMRIFVRHINHLYEPFSTCIICCL